MQAVQIIAEQAAIQSPVSIPAEKKTEKKFILPKPYRYRTYAVSYLQNRGIDMEMIQYCLKTGQVYESANYHNVVFVGKDQSGIPRYAALRGIGTDFVGEASGSDKNYSFCIPADGKCRTVHLFESAIDLLSYATEQKLDGNNWREEHLLSLAGVYQPAKEIEKSKVPAALTRFLREHPEVDMVVFHLDNDQTGRLATQAIQTVLPEKYQTKDEPPKQGKDCNDSLCIRLGIRQTKREKRQREKSLER